MKKKKKKKKMMMMMMTMVMMFIVMKEVSQVPTNVQKSFLDFATGV